MVVLDGKRHRQRLARTLTTGQQHGDGLQGTSALDQAPVRSSLDRQMQALPPQFRRGCAIAGAANTQVLRRVLLRSVRSWCRTPSSSRPTLTQSWRLAWLSSSVQAGAGDEPDVAVRLVPVVHCPHDLVALTSCPLTTRSLALSWGWGWVANESFVGQQFHRAPPRHRGHGSKAYDLPWQHSHERFPWKR